MTARSCGAIQGTKRSRAARTRMSLLQDGGLEFAGDDRLAVGLLGLGVGPGGLEAAGLRHDEDVAAFDPHDQGARQLQLARHAVGHRAAHVVLRRKKRALPAFVLADLAERHEDASVGEVSSGEEQLEPLARDVPRVADGHRLVGIKAGEGVDEGQGLQLLLGHAVAAGALLAAVLHRDRDGAPQHGVVLADVLARLHVLRLDVRVDDLHRLAGERALLDAGHLDHEPLAAARGERDGLVAKRAAEPVRPGGERLDLVALDGADAELDRLLGRVLHQQREDDQESKHGNLISQTPVPSPLSPVPRPRSVRGPPSSVRPRSPVGPRSAVRPRSRVAKRPARTGAARTGYARTGDARTGAARTGAARTGAARTGPARTGHARTGYARTGYARTGRARTGAARTGYARTGSYDRPET